ncbi:secreted RxLR effector protein 161-like [Phaseolus vulgaris]|uniref:secreted RxLR effector protein 161-like n=1 Tax=Phaseolus vulgaris TaxID=3885 RepID=UPI0035CB64EF
MISSMCLTRDGTTTVDDLSLYKSIVGSPQYVLITKPELSYNVNKVCQYLHNLQLHHWKAVKRILLYLAGTQSHGLLLQPSTHLSIIVFADADWGSDPDNRKSIFSYTVFLESNLVAWSSNKQKTVSYSTTETEYQSIDTALAEIKWVSNLLQELSISFPTPNIYSGNLRSCSSCC